MTTIRPAAALACLFLGLGLLPAGAAAQAQTTFSACYVPSVGAIYLIKVSGLPQACLSAQHQEITWSDASTFEIPSEAITSSLLAAGAVTSDKIAAEAVTPASIRRGAFWNFGGEDGRINMHDFGPDGGLTLLMSLESASANGPQARFDGASPGWWDYGLNGDGNFVIEHNDTPVCTITEASPTWACISSRDHKEGFQPVDAEAILRKVASLPILSWSYLGAPAVRHIGPTAQDFFDTFQLGDDDRTIAFVDADGVNLASIQALEARTRDLEAENQALQARLERLETLLNER